jgi:hypothetical protein
MKSVTIIISHYESLPFLRNCLRQIDKYKNPEIEQTVIVADQSSPATFDKIGSEVKYHLDPLYSGFSIDWLIRNTNITTDYICQLHVDAFPIHKNWLKLPITLLQDNPHIKFVGQHHFTSRQTDTVYPPGKFFSMSPTFNVAPTAIYKEMALEAGFTRYHNRLVSGLTFKSKVWDEWAQVDYRKRGSDDDAVAFHWEDTHREHDKLALGISGNVDKDGESGFGRTIEDLVFHFGSCRESIGVMGAFGRRYEDWTNRIKSEEGFSDELIAELLAVSIRTDPATSRLFWNGTTKDQSTPVGEMHKQINELKK